MARQVSFAAPGAQTGLFKLGKVPSQSTGWCCKVSVFLRTDHMLTIKPVAPETPATLLKKFENKIAGNGSSKEINTWVKATKEPYAGKFTHTSERQKEKAYFTATPGKEDLYFGIEHPGEKAPADWDYIYAYYHGHLTETFIHHFRDSFSTATSTAKPVVAAKPAAKTAPKAV